MAVQVDSGSTALANNNETILSTITTPGEYEFALDLNVLAQGTTPDTLEVYPKQKVLSSSTARVVDGFPLSYVGGLVASPVMTYRITVMHSTSFCIKQTQGTLRTFDWSVRRLDTPWDETMSSHTTAGTTGASLNAAGSAGDPWSITIPGSYGSGTAGHRLGNIPDIAAGSSGGLPTVDSNNAVKLQSGTGANQINLSSGGVQLSSTGLNGLLDLTDAIETGLTVRQALRIIAAAVAGKLSGAAGTTITIRNAVADGKDRIVATVDINGNRSAITYDLT